MQLQLGGLVFNSFWIGSVLVVVLTGLYTVLGGMRAVAYTEAMQTLILVFGSLLLTIYGLNVARRLGRAARGARPRDVQPVEAARAGRHRGHLGAGEGSPAASPGTSTSNYPWLGMLFCAPIIGLWYWCTDQYIVQRTLGAPNQTEARRGTIFAAFLKLLPVFIFIIPGMIALALAKTGQRRRPRRSSSMPTAHVVPAAAQAAFPLMVRDVLPTGPARHRRRRPAGRAHELARRRLQRLLDALHHRLLLEVPPGRDAGAAGLGRPRRDGRDGASIGLLWIPVIQGARGPLRLPAGRVRATSARRSSPCSSSACS